MLQLETFGGLTLSDTGGAPAPTSRLRLALLTLLAASGGRGLSRDKILAYLWPESSPENARHALEQLLYSLRRQIPVEIVTGGDPLRLNPAAVVSDVGLFEHKLAAGDLEGAVALYRGAFLDGVFLTNSPEFEAWVESERTRLARSYQSALYELAKTASSHGHPTAEIACWRRLTAADPMSERAAAGLARALAAAGDWPAAAEHARAYDALVRRDLGDTAATMAAQVERWRAEREAGDGESSTGRYTIVRQIGRGSMAAVLLARDEKLGRDVALKVLRPELAVSTAHERFQREIAILAGLHHPHILQIHDSGVLPPGGRWEGPFFVMPLVQGETLRARLDRGVQLPLEEVGRTAGDIVGALAYAHARGIVHRDIKPENILLEGGHALLADFGVAYALDRASGQSLSLSGVRLGAPGYMSPEQAAGGNPVDARSDLYSLGCVVYEMLAGEPPFSGATAQAIIARHAADPVPPLRTVRPEVSPEAEGVIRRALAKEPRERFGSAEELGEALAAALHR